MVNYLLEFKQEELLKLQTEDNNGKLLTINTDDVFILHYIVNAICTEKMLKIIENDTVYVWLTKEKMLEDMPILNITENRLAHIIGKLKKMGLLTTKTVANTKIRGSKSYIAITDLLLSCMNEQSTIYNKCTNVKNNKSNNKLLDNKLNKEYNNKLLYSSKNSKSSNFNFGYNKPKSNIPKSLSYLTTMIQDNDLRSLLVEYYRKRQKEPSTRISADDYKHCVTDLLNMDTDIEHLKEIVTRTIDGNEHRVYRKWVDPRQKSTNYNSFSKTDLNQGANIHSTQYTEEELKELEEIDKERERKGLRTKF
jgi:hypothetical protein